MFVFIHEKENRQDLAALSSAEALPLGIPIKISIIEKIESARGTPRALSFSFSPASPQHKSLPTTQRGLCGGERGKRPVRRLPRPSRSMHFGDVVPL